MQLFEIKLLRFSTKWYQISK